MKKRILLADDEKIFTKVLVTELEEAGYLVDKACDGVEAVLMATKDNYDIALLDVKMPNLDGLNTIKILKKMNKRMPIISYSGSVRQDYFKEIINAGAVMFVPKPFSPTWLISQIRWVIGE